MDYAAAARAAAATTSVAGAAGAAAMMPRYKMFIMRGPSGSGKTHFAKTLGGVRLSADDYFVDADGVYRWDRYRLAEAHDWNQQRALQAIAAREPTVVIDNTNLEAWQAHPYVKAATAAGYTIAIIDATTPWCRDAAELAARNEHSVSEDLCADMIRRWDHCRYTVAEALAARTRPQ